MSCTVPTMTPSPSRATRTTRSPAATPRPTPRQKAWARSTASGCMKLTDAPPSTQSMRTAPSWATVSSSNVARVPISGMSPPKVADLDDEVASGLAARVGKDERPVDLHVEAVAGLQAVPVLLGGPGGDRERAGEHPDLLVELSPASVGLVGDARARRERDLD